MASLISNSRADDRLAAQHVISFPLTTAGERLSYKKLCHTRKKATPMTGDKRFVAGRAELMSLLRAFICVTSREGLRREAFVGGEQP